MNRLPHLEVPADSRPLLCRLTDELDRVTDASCRICVSQYWQKGVVEGNEQSPRVPYAPDRVIEILDTPSSDTVKIRLVAIEGIQKGNYTALSHRWGGAFTLKTTKASLSDHPSGFEFDDLPQTFQDAVLVTKALGIRYLWVDSLCIIQDDYEDWLGQSQKMGSIYSNAAITIVAHSSGQCNEGFLWRCQVPSTLRIAPKVGPGFVISIPQLGLEHMKRQFSDLTDSKILKRSWALQELTLSSRILHFVGGGLLWECQHQKPSFQNSEFDTPASIFRTEHTILGVYSAWLWLVQSFSNCQMTNQDDKLMAISGALNILHRQTDSPAKSNHQYGIFESDIERSLLWYVAGGNGQRLRNAPS